MNTEKKRKEILDVLNYKDGSYYVGSMKMYDLSRILEIGYPGDISGAVKKEDRTIIDKIHNALIKYIKHMHQYPKKKCRLCGSIVPA